MSKSKAKIAEKTSKAEIAEIIKHRVGVLGIGQSAFAATTGLNLFDLPGLMNGEESEITAEQLQGALETLNLSDSVREIVDIKADVASPEVIYHVCNPVADAQVPGKVYYYASRETVRREIGLRIRKRRQELGRTQDALAAMLGYSREALSHYETGGQGWTRVICCISPQF